MESQTDQIQQVRKLIDIAFRRKMLIIGFLLVTTAIGLALYLIQPKVYQSSSLLIFQSQKVSPAKMAPEVRGRIRDITSTISQLVLSRTSLEKIIEDHGLYRESRKRLPMADVIQAMKEHIEIEPSRRGDTFSISFKGQDPETVARVTNTLAARFVEENLKYRQERATETSSYAQNELDMAKETLDEKEAVLRDYKLKYYNEMPEQRQTNVEMLNALHLQLQGKQESIQDLERTRVLIQDQITARKQILEQYVSTRTTIDTSQDSDEILTNRQQLELLKAKKESLLSRYTDKHPKMRSLVKQIDRLEDIVASEPKKSTAKQSSSNLDSPGEVHDKILFDLQLQLKEIGLQISKINKDMAILENQAEKYKKWVAAAPVREAEWSAISREYGELKRHYDFLVAQNLQAKSAMHLERKQQGSQFKIEDPARVPVKPIRPVFIKIMGLAVIMGLALGGGLSFGLEFLDTSFRDPISLENAYGVEVLCSVPNIALRNEVIRKRVLGILGASTVVVSSGLILAAMLYFWKLGRIVL